MPTIVIRGTPIDFPNSSASPNWAPAVIQFAQAVEAALDAAITNFDVPPQVFVIDGGSFNPQSTPTNLTNLSFPTTEVRGAIIEYAIYRTADSPSVAVAETGSIWIAYNTSAGTWEINRSAVGDASVIFSITNAGQVQFTTLQIGTANHLGKISYRARVLPLSSL